ncbi:hypothetical protein ACWF99_12315 [Nocardia sp. NPDC055002]
MIADARLHAGQGVVMRKAQRRHQFLDAATQVRAERGHLSCSLIDICESAGLSKRQSYEEFETLDEVRIASYARVQDDAAVAVAQNACRPDRVRRLVACPHDEIPCRVSAGPLHSGHFRLQQPR